MDNQVRDAEIALGYLQGESVPKLCRKYKLSSPRIWSILREQRVSRKEVISEAETCRIVDTAHAKIGHRVYVYRSRKNLPAVEVAEHMGWSVKKLRNIEHGYTVLTLPDLMDLAEYMRTPLTEFVKGLEECA